MKRVLSLVLGGIFLLFQAASVWAAPVSFTVSATVPLATGISLVVDSVNATGTANFTPVTGNSLSFDPMTFNSNNIYVPSIYYAINVSSSNGSGLPDTTVTYVEGNNPNGSSATQFGLGTKSTATFAQELNGVETITALGKKRLIDLTGSVGHVPYTSLATGSYLRVYVGVWTGSMTAPADPASGQPFSNADASGPYTGTLTVTAVVN